MYRKKDFFLSIISGFLTGFISALIFRFLKLSFIVPILNFRFSGDLWFNLIWFIPILWVLGVYLGYKLSSFIPWLFQFSKFIAIGFLNTSIDFGILNLLVYLSGITKGLSIIGLNSISFLIAVINSYFWNKGWTFSLGTQLKAEEFTKYIIVTFFGLLINNGIVFLGTTLINPLFKLTPILWINFVKAIGIIVSLTWNFIGYKIIVFKR